MIYVSAAVIADNRTHVLGHAGQVGNQLFGSLLAQLGVLLHRAVQVRHVGLVMLVVVQLHRCFVDGGFESGVVVGKGREFKSHGSCSFSCEGFAEHQLRAVNEMRVSANATRQR